MKGVVLTGGKGSRLRPFTYSGAKQLVPIANVPVLHFPVRQLVACGITEIALVVGDTEAQIRSAMGDGSEFGARFTYLRQDAPLGIAHGLGLARDFAGDEPVILYLGDNVLLNGIEAFADAFSQRSDGASVILKSVPDPRAFGVALMDRGRIMRVLEKPQEPPSDLAVIGVYAFRPQVFDVIEKLRPSARGELEIADAINGIIDAAPADIGEQTGGMTKAALFRRLFKPRRTHETIGPRDQILAMARRARTQRVEFARSGQQGIELARLIVEQFKQQPFAHAHLPRSAHHRRERLPRFRGQRLVRRGRPGRAAGAGGGAPERRGAEGAGHARAA